MYPLGNTPSAPSVCQIMKATQFIKDDGTQGTSILHSQFQHRIGLFLACVVMNDSTTESRALIRVKVVASEFATGHTTDGMNEVVSIKVLEPVLIRVVGVGMAIEVHRRRVLLTLFVTSVL